MPRFLGALDQGTTSTRFIVFDDAGRDVARSQLEHRQILPAPGWVEHDPMEIARASTHVIAGALRGAGLTGGGLAAIGITNQRETTVVWDPVTGRPWHNAIVWQDTRTDRDVAALEPHRSLLCERTGLPPATYFSSSKLRWILEHVDGVRDAARRGRALFGTMDTWVIWNLTGGPDGGRHVTDATNASRTQLMDLRTLQWDDDLLDLFDIPREMLPRICPSSSPPRVRHDAGRRPARRRDPDRRRPRRPARGHRRPGVLLAWRSQEHLRHRQFPAAEYRRRVVRSTSGLLTTLAYRLDEAPPVYALEGSIAVTGAAVQWLRDQLGIIESAHEIEALAASVPDSGGICFVPAFSGLFAPYWRPDARGAIVGLSRFHTKAHLARATLEAICFQTRDIVEAMALDSGVRLGVMKVDGGATVNDLLMQMQADMLGVPIVRPLSETTALGAAYAAGLAVGVWTDPDAARALEGRPSVGSALERRPARRGIRWLAQSRGALPRLGVIGGAGPASAP